MKATTMPRFYRLRDIRPSRFGITPSDAAYGRFGFPAGCLRNGSKYYDADAVDKWYADRILAKEAAK